MHVNLLNIIGEIVKDNQTYILEDNNLLENLTLSKTTLKPGMKTNGHSHELQEEVYFFIEGHGRMVLDGEDGMVDVFDVTNGSIVLIPKGKFHKVINVSNELPCSFVCVFEKYDRSGDQAQYLK
jgi:oxalate decarboxylase/phosphoglucose isomerase-like protein (cupin superfamily)